MADGRRAGFAGRILANLRDDLHALRWLAGAQVRGQAQYRASFITQVIANGLLSFSEFVTLIVLFQHTSNLAGWTVGQVAVLYGMSSIGFGIGHFLASGLSGFSTQLVRGELDRMLIRPVSPFVQVMGSDVQLRRIGIILQGIIGLVIGLSLTDVPWSPGRVIAFPLIILGTTVLFMALFALEATISFWTTQGIEAVNITTYGGNQVSSWPIDVFATWLKRLFLWFVPLAFAVHIPVSYLLGKPAPLGLPGWIGLLSPGMIVLFAIVVGSLWRLGLRRYRSTGS